MLLRSSAKVVDVRPGEWWRVWRHWARGWTIEVAEPNALQVVGEWACTQSMFQGLPIWELVKLRRVLCLRRRPNECWVDHMKRTGVIVARQLKKHNHPRVQTLQMRRVRIAAWQTVNCPSDAKGRSWEEFVT